MAKGETKCVNCLRPITGLDAKKLRKMGICRKCAPESYFCQAITEKKTRCKYVEVSGGYCKVHGGDNPMTKLNRSIISGGKINNHASKIMELFLNNNIRFHDVEKTFRKIYVSKNDDQIYYKKEILYPIIYHYLNIAIATRTDRLKIIKGMCYSKYLQTREWHIKRQILISLYQRCQLCGKQKKYYHVHHNRYKNKPLERMLDLIVLCEECHNGHHAKP